MRSTWTRTSVLTRRPSHKLQSRQTCAHTEENTRLSSTEPARTDIHTHTRRGHHQYNATACRQPNSRLDVLHYTAGGKGEPRGGVSVCNVRDASWAVVGASTVHIRFPVVPNAVLAAGVHTNTKYSAACQLKHRNTACPQQCHLAGNPRKSKDRSHRRTTTSRIRIHCRKQK